ncbi:5298_t:CDS:2, partial [Funneliformis mosseae]
SSDNQDTDEESIGREYDSNKKHNHYTGHTGPYFPNFTTFLIFLWITKHQIGFKAYKDFANIIKHSEFNSDDVPYSLATIKKYRDGLLLLPFKGHKVTLNNRNMPSTSKPTRNALNFSLKDILHRVLANLLLRENMYFGLGVYCENKHELWHGDLWHKSPLFGNIEHILEFNSLPLMLKSQQRRIASHKGYLWMTDETLIINPAKIKSKVDIWLIDVNKPNNYQYVISKIVYCVNTRWTTSPFCTAYHTIGSLYLQIGNMKQTLCQKLKNHFLFGFILFTATSDKVTSGLGVITRDLPEGNEQAGVKNHNAHHGCRNCMIHHRELDNVSFDTARHSRYHHKTILQFSTIRRVQTQA